MMGNEILLMISRPLTLSPVAEPGSRPPVRERFACCAGVPKTEILGRCDQPLFPPRPGEDLVVIQNTPPSLVGPETSISLHVVYQHADPGHCFPRRAPRGYRRPLGRDGPVPGLQSEY